MPNGNPMRLVPPDPATLTEDQRRVYDQITNGPRGQVRGPLAIWLHRPGLAETAQSLGAYCRYGSSLEPRLSELAILCMAVATADGSGRRGDGGASYDSSGGYSGDNHSHHSHSSSDCSSDGGGGDGGSCGD